MKINGPTHLYHPDFDGYKEVKTQAEYDALIDADDQWSDSPYPEEKAEAADEPAPPAPTLTPKKIVEKPKRGKK